MKKIQYILAGTMLVSLSLGAQAQTQPQDTTMNRTVVVEQEYNPEKRRRRKRCPDMYAWDTVTTVTSMYAPTTSSPYPPKTAST